MKVNELICEYEVVYVSEGSEIADELANAEFGMDYDQLGEGEKEWVRDEMENRGLVKTKELDESSIRQWKRMGTRLVKKYRCLAGPKKGKLVAQPNGCATRKDPKKVRHGRKVMRSKRGTIARKSKISKRKSMSRVVTNMNKKLMGKA